MEIDKNMIPEVWRRSKPRSRRPSVCPFCKFQATKQAPYKAQKIQHRYFRL
jgi:hypothetical protein